MTLTALVLDQVGNAMRDRKVVWASENTAVATVSQSGVVTGVASGTVQIAASSGGKSTNAAITVTARPVTLVRITPGSATISVTGSVTLHAEALDASGAPVPGRPVVWTSSNETIAVVGGGGVVAGIAAGTVTITATIDGQAGTAAVTVAPQPVASVSVSPASDTITVGRRVTFRATPLDANNLPLAGRAILWTSSDPAIATVSSVGEVVGLGVGAARIRATVEGKFAEGAIVVQPVPVATVTIAPSNPTMSVGQTLGMTAIMRDAAGNVLTRDVTWASTNPSVATINANTGMLTAVASGTASVTASVIGDPASGSTTITVSVVQVARVDIAPTTVTLSPGQTSQFTATAYDANTPPNVLVGAISWRTNNSAVATVTTSGLVTAVGSGSTTILATAGGVTGTAVVTVASVPVGSVTVTPSAPNMFPGDVLTLTATARDAGGNVVPGRPATWVSSNTSAATVVAATGVVTAVATGTATITATVDGVSGSASVAINAMPVASVTLAPTSTSLFQGQQTGFIATARDASGNVISRPMTWATTNATVISVTQGGIVTAIGPGTAGVIAMAVGAGAGSTNVGDTASVAVTLVPVASMAISPKSLSLSTGQPQQITVQLLDSAGGSLSQAGRSISFLSRDPAIATVSASGQVGGVATGTTRVVVSTPGANTTLIDSVSVTVTAASSILSLAVQPKPINLYQGGTKALRAMTADASGTVRGRAVSWLARNPSIATVTPVPGIPDSAIVAGVSLGSTYVIANDPSGLRDSSLITVQLVPAVAVVVTPSSASLSVKGTTQLVPTAKDSAGNTLSRTITWVSQSPSIASVSSTGLVTAHAGGSTTIEARAVGAGVNGADVVGTATITVGQPVRSVTVTAPRGFIVPGDTMHLTVVLRDAQNNVVTGRPITFVSSAPWNATVDAAGVVTGVSSGSAYLVAASEGKFGSVQISGENGIAAMRITGPNNNIKQDTLLSRGDEEEYIVTVTDASGKPVKGHVITISNSNPSAMSLSKTSDVTDSKGEVEVDITAANSAGSATITFTASRAGAIPPGAPGSNTPAVSIRIVVP